MLIPVLIGGATLGLWLLLKNKDSTATTPAQPPKIDPPKDVDLVSWDVGEVVADKVLFNYGVTTVIFKQGQETYINSAEFLDWTNAWEYYKQNVAFFDENSGNWTCPDLTGHISIIIYEVKVEPHPDGGGGYNTYDTKATKAWATCPGSDLDAVLHRSDIWEPLVKLREFVNGLKAKHGALSIPKVPTVRMLFVTKDKQEFIGTFEFKTVEAAGNYYQYLQDSFKTKAAVDFYRPDGGRLVVMVLFGSKTWQSGDADGFVSWWDGSEIPDSFGNILPHESMIIGG